MKPFSMHHGIWVLSAMFFASLFLVAVSHAQAPGGNAAQQEYTATDAMATEMHMLTDVQTQGIDHKELDAYKAFYNQTQEMGKKIQLGQDFLQKYPKSTLIEPVEAGLVQAYVDRQDWKNVYISADSALALKPNDIDVLTTVGWVIPHVYRPDDPDGDAQLAKAETYEKHALDVLATMPKPKTLTDAQFAAAKNQKAAQAHSALGLIYFRCEDYDTSAKEIQQVLQLNPTPDPTDLYVLGIDLQNVKRYSDAADAFNRCAQIAGGLQDRCKQSADTVKRIASVK
jgi:tetratricopeptide (TPR) repeat protein